MQRHPEITRQRLQAFTSDKGLRGILYPQRRPVSLAVFSTPERIPYEQAVRAEYTPAAVGQRFGPAWSTHWFHVQAAIPVEWAGQEVHLLWDSSSEACVWQDGQPRQGLTGSASDFSEQRAIRPAYRLARAALGGEPVDLYMEMACNTLFGQLENGEKPAGEYRLRQAELAVFDRAAWDLLWDFVVIADLARCLPADGPRAGQALAAANRMVNLCRLDDRSTWAAAHAAAAEFYAAHNGDGQHNLSAIGHAHLDTAWLWPTAETRRKVVRTFSNALRLMEDYPAYRFTHSQAQQFAWLKEAQPALYDQVRARVKEGRLIPVGGSWVEPDCNLPGGESLVRQFLYGQRFFQAEFGARSRVFWNPDVFGYPAALPQILRGAGIEYFLTQKLSWNQFNKPAYSTFLWEGLDGSRVLTHFPPADTYNSLANVEEVLRSVHNFKEHDRARESYLLFGYGDGGGGPTAEMLEQLRRMEDVDGLPRVAIRSPLEFFTRCAADIQDPLVWVGELYLEYHRGTYTTQARNKRDNRRSELLLRDVEALDAMGLALGRSAGYPAEEIERLWKLALLNQFHDILPGSSITQVYADSAQDYAHILDRGASLRSRALDALCGGGGAPVVVNTLGWPREEVIEAPAELAEGAALQRSADGRALALVQAPPLGWQSLRLERQPDAPVSLEENEGGYILQNGRLRAEISRGGQVSRLFDLCAGRDALVPGEAGNVLTLYDDDPVQFEAWDVDVFHLEKYRLVEPAGAVRVVEAGPLRAAVEFEVRLSPKSRLRQRISLCAGSPRLDFDTWVDWHEQKQFLKVEFPLNVRADQATYEVQYGHVRRPTHTNTSYDLARFEVCAHHWADLSEHGYGVALLNDCKYGYSVSGSRMRLSLLRGSFPAPDPTSDQGVHRFRYALLPHRASFQEAGVIAAGYGFNVPLLVSRSPQESGGPFFRVDQAAVVIDALKKAEDSPALILRLYESFGGRWPVKLTSPLPIRAVTRCNLLEDEEQTLEWRDGALEFAVRPFEIVTLKFELAG